MDSSNVHPSSQAAETSAAISKSPQGSKPGDKLNEDELELHLWQKALFLDDGSSVRNSVDSLRLRLAHLHYYCEKEYVSMHS